ncbi:MAG TPA: Gfo/Idh/MocA family oxidoreductase [Kribbellaceae bacterium]|jgi:predicted dehydrogenase
MTPDRVRWGILATGWVAGRFTEDLRLLDECEVVAVGSRTLAAAEAFASRHDIPRAYGSWAALAADPDVDVVYVATPHAAHRQAALTCIDAGKAVLVEKPVTLDAGSAQELVTAARRRGTFLMEAMWMRCLPVVRRVARLIADGAIGAVTSVRADFGLPGPFDPAHRLRDPALGGGATLDLGIYPVTLAHLALGMPDTVQAVATRTPEGVDENTGILLGYPSGAVATLSCGFVGETPCTAAISGTLGRIDLPSPFYRPDRFTLHGTGAAPAVVEEPIRGWGYHFEAAEVNRCLRAGLGESPLVPASTSVAVLSILDQIRARIGVTYPGQVGP